MIVNKNMTAVYWATIIFIIASFVSCNSAPATQEEYFSKPGTDTLGAFTETTVAVYVVKKEQFSSFIRSEGKVRPVREQLVRSESNSRLIQLKGRTGTFVASGNLIAQLETTPILQRLEKAELSKYNSEKEYASQLLGYENLLVGKTKEEADAIRKKLRISSGLSGAELDIKEIGYELKKASVRAPFSGVLADVKVQQGEQVTVGQELFRIYDPNSLFLEIKILESDMPSLRPGTPAEIIPVSSPSTKYRGNISEINPYVDEDGLIQVRIKINSTVAARIFPGMNCTSVIQVPLSEALVVPKEAIVMRNGREVIFTIDNGRAKWNYVVAGRENGTGIEIREGLKEGQKVIITNNLQLAHDAPVKEIETAVSK